MSDDATTSENPISEPREFIIQIKISDKNLQYKSDFNEAETVFWLEAVKDLVLKNAFEKADLQKS